MDAAFFVGMMAPMQRSGNDRYAMRTAAPKRRTIAMSTATAASKVEQKVEQWHTPAKVCEITSFGKSFIYQKMASGELKSKKVGAGRRISDSQLADWQASFDGAGEVAE